MAFRLFGRGRDLSTELHALAVAEFARQGMPMVVEETPDGPALQPVDGGSVAVHLDNVIGRAQELPRREWRPLVESFVTGVVEALTEPDVTSLTAEQWRSQVRTRIYPVDAPDLDLSYARELVPGLVVALCLDNPSTVLVLSAETLADAPVTVDELYAIGQANTDDEPIDEPETVGDLVNVLEGDSFYVAAKAANLAALVPSVTGPAPYGIAFAIPDRHMLMYTVISDTHAQIIEAVSELAEANHRLCHDETFNHPGGFISDRTYYWAPDGTIEHLAGVEQRHSGPTLRVVPGEKFLAHLDRCE